MKKYTFFVDFKEKKSPRTTGGKNTKCDGEQCTENLSIEGLSWNGVEKILKGGIFSRVDKNQLNCIAGASVMQYTDYVEYPQPITLTLDNIRDLVRCHGYFLLETFTSSWQESKHKLCSFFVITFSFPLQGFLPAGHHGYKCFHYSGTPYYITGNNGDLSVLDQFLSDWHRHYSDTPCGELCFIDYFTTKSWVMWAIEYEQLKLFEKSNMGIVLTIHQNMKIDLSDKRSSLFHHILRNPQTRAFINGQGL